MKEDKKAKENYSRKSEKVQRPTEYLDDSDSDSDDIIIIRKPKKVNQNNPLGGDDSDQEPSSQEEEMVKNDFKKPPYTKQKPVEEPKSEPSEPLGLSEDLKPKPVTTTQPKRPKKIVYEDDSSSDEYDNWQD